ncbi:MAG: transporter substrate-binding domain-containing protein [Pseudonocardiaceae bacterium]
MPDGQLQRRWPEPPGSKAPPGARSWTVLRRLHAGGWLRPRRIGCLLLVFAALLIAPLWALGSCIQGTAAVFRNEPDPVSGSPFDTVIPTRPPSSGSPTIDRITQRGKPIVALQQVPGLADRSPGPRGYAGFDFALLDLIARDLGVDPAEVSVKPIPAATIGIGMLKRGEADFALGGFEITAQRRAEVGIAGPYLVRPLRLAVPADSPVRSLDSLGDGAVCAPADSPAATMLAVRLGHRLITRASLAACASLLGRAVEAIAGDQAALYALPALATGELQLVGEPLGTTEYGIGLPPGDDVLRERVTAVLRTAVNDGTWARLYAEHLGTPVPTPPAIR